MNSFGMQNELYTILAERKLKTVYQPIYQLESLQAYAYESLARGPAESRYAHPLTLFQDAIDMQIAHEVDLLAIQTALQGAENKIEGLLFINVLPSTLMRKDAMEQLLEITENSSLKHRLVLELTERTQVRDLKELRTAVNLLRTRGIRVAIDDLGQGYSSLAAVIELEPEYIKLDRSLVSGISKSSLKQKIVDVLVSISNEDMFLVAEGIEATSDLEYLKKAGIPFGQGYLLGMPKPLSVQAG
ncbi:diguanylate phosphodiesterase [Collibacillus ludicampi]|uniref:Diguanylate phosphodiesterase n=1 Tax=Collibacillus ludicampi TaxID=2771369 RepID=A0AAV4LCP6_9BACL|nr:EAL domain-containing protein [Collibacillus ludicampi]GIM45474.1 diguanylate phosphodiesterase [Collibacillus ludicampi]